MEAFRHLPTAGAAVLDATERPAAQQPQWPDPVQLAAAREEVRAGPALVGWDGVRRLGDLLARAATGDFCVLQAGDCAEDPAECGADDVERKVEMLDVLADIMRVGSGRPVLTVGRMAGQFAKPRSNRYEEHHGRTLPVYRGTMVNSPEPYAAARVPDPRRLVRCRDLALGVLSAVDGLGHGDRAADTERIWTSHEALVLDYEVPLVRPTGDGGHYLASTHWPWIGERTRQPDGAHVRLLASLRNPIACKVSSDASVDDVLRLCEVLDPDRTPGRLTFTARFGARRVERLEPLVRAVREAGYPVLWMCDPMHGNTTRGAGGLKVRRLDEIMNEIRLFVSVVAAGGGVCAGLHIETSPNAICECDGAGIVPGQGGAYQTLCDPRLNLMQAVAACAHWQPRTAATRTAKEDRRWDSKLDTMG
ncbi:3-deoxy-7-phosphoheptulonate synthase [Streptantibioticus parmotrematis]|uniref:3-deoxy-7-phosphoheptulonate synthase n=1 Tax=Streptantibioticus parmotrematis TaxID=2873249 RepID=UPI0033C2C279